MNGSMTLRQNYEKSKQVGKPTPTLESKREQSDPLAKWLGHEVIIVFISGRSLTGKLTAVFRFDIEITDDEGTQNHVCKHAVERIRPNGR